MAVELPHEIPYSLPNAIDVADPPALILLHISSTFGIDHIKSISEDVQSCRGGPRDLCEEGEGARFLPGAAGSPP